MLKLKDMSDLEWTINKVADEINDFLSEVRSGQFIADVKEFIKKQQDNAEIKQAIEKLQELL